MGVFSDAARNAFSDNRPGYIDPWSVFGSRYDDPLGQGAPLWQRCAWLGHPYTNPAQGNTVPGTVTATTPSVVMAAVGGKGSGKAQPLSEPVLTPHGWSTMGEIRVGDFVVGCDGTPTRVLGVYPQGKQGIYRLTMNDGTFVRATGDHLWAVRDGKRKMRGSSALVLTTEELLARGIKTSQGYNKWYLPEMRPVAFASCEQPPIPPYALGALLGDGGLRVGCPVLSSADVALVDRVARETATQPRRLNAYDYRLVQGGRGGAVRVNTLKNRLIELGLWGKMSKDKFIPPCYLIAPIADRIELLRGLMDTDGCITSVGTGEFNSSSRRLAEDVCDLVRSLGGVTRVRVKAPAPGYGESYRVRLNLPFNPFWIERKASAFNTQATQGRAKSIAAIEPDGHEEAVCIAVEAADSLYVTRDYNVTHNTLFGALRAAHLIQTYPGGQGFVVANSYGQAFGSAAAKLVYVANALGLRYEYYTQKTINGLQYNSVYYFPDYDHIVAVLSFDNISLIEGSEWDWMWCEEIQDCLERDVNVAASRVRRGVGDHSMYFAGMPDDGQHWMYRWLEEQTILAGPGRGEPVPLYEPPLTENLSNNPEGYMEGLRLRNRSVDIERYVSGARISLGTARCLPSFSIDLHQRSETALRLSAYDPSLPIGISLDFNVNPMCATVRQVKPLDLFDPDGRYRTTKMVAAQVAEYEIFGATTDAMCDALLEDFGRMGRIAGPSGHVAGGFVVGDATGSRRDTRSPGVTDWTIIRDRLSALPGLLIRPGCVLSRRPSSESRGRKLDTDRYSNPPVRDRVIALEQALVDKDGDIRVTWLPHSAFASGGSARSCSSALWTADGRIDDRADKSSDKAAARTHFFDEEGYYFYFARHDGRRIVGLFDADEADAPAPRRARRADVRTSEAMLRSSYDASQAPASMSAPGRSGASVMGVAASRPGAGAPFEAPPLRGASPKTAPPNIGF